MRFRGSSVHHILLHNWKLTSLLALSFLFVSCGSESDRYHGAGGPITYELYTTTGGDSVFEYGQLGAINRGLLGMFKRVNANTEAHFAVFDWTIPEMADSLIEALTKHSEAKVEIIMDPRNFAAAVPAERSLALEKLRSLDAGRIRLVNDEKPLAGLLNDENGRRSRMQNRFFLFHGLDPSENDAGLYTVAISSADLDYGAVGESNEMIIVHGDEGLYERFLDYWKAMEEAKTDFTFGSTHTYSDIHDHQAWFFPQSEKEDFMEGVLDRLEEGLKQTRKPAKVRLAISVWHACRTNIATRLLDLQRKFEADVRILVKEDLDIALNVRNALMMLPEGSLRFLPSRHKKLQYGLHSNLLLIDGPYPLTTGAEPDRRRLSFIGSHSWDYDALRRHSGTWLRVSDQGVYDEMEKHWEELWQKGVDTTDIYEGGIPIFPKCD